MEKINIALTQQDLMMLQIAIMEMPEKARAHLMAVVVGQAEQKMKQTASVDTQEVK